MKTVTALVFAFRRARNASWRRLLSALSDKPEDACIGDYALCRACERKLDLTERAFDPSEFASAEYDHAAVESTANEVFVIHENDGAGAEGLILDLLHELPPSGVV